MRFRSSMRWYRVVDNEGSQRHKSIHAECSQSMPVSLAWRLREVLHSALLNAVIHLERAQLDIFEPNGERLDRSALKETPDLSAYETIYLGYPIWWGRPSDVQLHPVRKRRF